MKAKVKDCKVCGYTHVFPKPDEDVLDEMYKVLFYEEEKPNYVKDYNDDKEWWLSIYNERFEYAKRSLEGGQGSALDVGSGTGLFLEAGKNLNWDVIGVEPSQSVVEHCRSLGLDVVEGFFDRDVVDGFGNRKFDFVHMSQVLEHVLKPEMVLSLSREVLSDDGVICIVVPNDFNELQLALRDHDDYEPWWVVPKHHINYFSYDSLRNLLKKSGFEVVRETTTFPMEFFLMMGDKYVGNDELGRICHKKRMRMEMLMEKSGLSELKSALYASLAKLGLGREIVMYAKKV